MKIKTQLLIYLVVLAVVDLFFPFPIAAVILIYVILKRPAWFKEHVEKIYHSDPNH